MDYQFDTRKISEDLGQILKEKGFEGAINIVEELADNIYEKGTKRKAPDLDKVIGGAGDFINIIPSSSKGDCAWELIVLCLENDSLYKRLTETVYHVGITCKNENHKVLFITSQWKMNIYEDHEKAIKNLQYNGVDFCFVLLGKSGACSMPV